MVSNKNLNKFVLFCIINLMVFSTKTLKAQTCSNEISGLVYQDYNFNSQHETYEKGIKNFLVVVYKAGPNGTSIVYDSIRTDANGNYKFISVPTGNYRLEFVSLSSLPTFQSQLANTNDVVRFVTESACNQNLPIIVPSYYCQENPEVVGTCFVSGDNNNVTGSNTTLLSAPYNSSGNSVSATNYAINSDIGSVWGVTYNKIKKKIYTSAFVKRHIGLGEDVNGNALLGAIYETDPVTKQSKLFLNLADYGIYPGFISNNTGAGTRELATGGAYKSIDAEGFFKTGKVGIGGIDVDPCDTFLYALNLYDKTVYKFSTESKNLVKQYPIPANLCDIYNTFQMNLGGKAFVDGQGKQWFHEGYFIGNYPRVQFPNQIITNTNNAIEGTADTNVYRSVMVSPEMFFKIAVSEGKYDIRLHFVENVANLKRKIDFYAENILYLDDYQTSGVQWEAKSVLIPNVTVTDGIMDLRFMAAYNASLPTVSIAGIELLPKESQKFCEAKPFAVQIDKGQLYVGMVCASEYTQDTSKLKAFVLRWDEATNQFVITYDFKLTYQKGLSSLPDCAAGYPCGDIRGWFPWATVFTFDLLGTQQCKTIYPQPILADLNFDDDGSLVLGFMDRAGNQMAPNNYDLLGVNVGPISVASGDVLRVCNTSAGLKLEGSHPECPSNSLNGEGPGGGEFYHGDSTYISLACHPEASFGGLALRHGSREVVFSALDPTDSPLSGGAIRVSSVHGGRLDGFRFYENFFNSPNSNTSKANGIGDLTLTCSNAPIEFGNYVWLDSNKNGIQDISESGISGVSISVYNQSKQLIGTTITDAIGHYIVNQSILTIDSLIPFSEYYIVFGSNGQYNTTTKTLFGQLELTTVNATSLLGPDLHDSDADTMNMFSGLPFIKFNTAKCGFVNYTLDAGFYLPAQLGNYVWVDDNGDGIQEITELGLNNVKVLLKDTNNNILDSTFTVTGGPNNKAGYYQFTSLDPGSYIVMFIKPTNYLFTKQDIGLDSLDSDANIISGNSAVVNLLGGESNQTIDAGIYLLASIGNYVWFDANRNGIQDNIINPFTHQIVGPELPVPNVKMCAYDAFTNNLIACSTTDANGIYSISNLVPGKYYVKPDNSNFATLGYIITSDNAGIKDSIDSDIDSLTFSSEVICLTSGQVNPSIDMGIIVDPTASIGDPCTCHDIVYDKFEKYEVLDTIKVHGTPGAVWVIIAQTGMMKVDTFTNIDILLGTTLIESSPGNYYLRFAHDVGIGYTVTVTNGVDTLKFANKCFVSNITTSLDTIDRLCILEPPFQLSGFGTPGPGIVIFTIDSVEVTEVDPSKFNPGDTVLVIVRFIPSSGGQKDCPQSYEYPIVIGPASECAASIGDCVWNDLNANGIQEPGEPGIGGVSVVLTDLTNNTTQTLTTNGNGKYFFENLAPRDYKLTFGTLPNYAPTIANVGSDDKDSDAAAAGMTGIYSLSKLERDSTADAGFYVPVIISGKTWEDKNYDGIHDSTEPGINGVTVLLKNKNGVVIRTTTSFKNTQTNVDGCYEFTGVVPGEYIVMFMQPSLKEFTHQNIGPDSTDSDPDIITGNTEIHTVISGDNNLHIDAGFYCKATIGNLVWEDLDKDGIRDTGEPGVNGVTVLLKDANLNVIATALTAQAGPNNVDGYYEFTNVIPGKYIVMFMPPAAYKLTIKDAGTVDTLDSDPNAVSGNTDVYCIGSGEINYAIDAGLVLVEADLALRKTVESPTDGFLPGDIVRFKFEIFNQGIIPISEYSLKDYIDVSAYSFESNLPDNGLWSLQSGVLVSSLPHTINVGASDVVYLQLRVKNTFDINNAINYAEISAIKNAIGKSVLDIDSYLDSNTPYENSVLPGSLFDNVIDGRGEAFSEDEDDHDPAVPNYYNVSLEKKVVGEKTYRYGDVATFELLLTNNGNQPVKNIQIEDAIPQGFEFLPSNLLWTYANGIASTTYTNIIYPGQSASVFIDLKVIAASNEIGNPWLNDAKIVCITDSLNNKITKTDTMRWRSKKDIPVCDLALKFNLANNITDVKTNDTIPFVLCVYNQGNRRSQSADLSVYLPDASTFIPGYLTNTQFNLNFSTITTSQVFNLEPADSFKMTVYLKVIPIVDLSLFVPYAEISAFTGPDGGVGKTDADSYPDDSDLNDAGGLAESAADNFINGNGTGLYRDGVALTDEDDHDPAKLQLIDYALIIQEKQATSKAGQNACFDITVYNQKSIAASEITLVITYPIGFGAIDPAWTVIGDFDNHKRAIRTISIGNGLPSNGLPSNFSTVIPVCFELDAQLMGGTYPIFAEIASLKDLSGNELNNFDIDSKPDMLYNDDAGANLIGSNDIVDGNGQGTFGLSDPLLDEDDNDIAAICVLSLQSIVGPETVCANSISTYKIELYNPSNSYKWSLDKYGYIIGCDSCETLKIQWTGQPKDSAKISLVESIEEGCENEVSKTIKLNIQVPLACDNLVNISMGEECTVEIKPDHILEGLDGTSDVYIELKNKQGKKLPSTILDYHYIGDTLNVTAYSNCGSDVNSCWGRIVIEDKLPPVLKCHNHTMLCTAQIVNPFILKADYLPFDAAVSYTYLGGNAAMVSPGGIDCQETKLSYEDNLIHYTCNQHTTLNGILVRTWTAIDKSGNKYSCNDTIFIRRVTLDDIVPPSNYDDVDKPTLESCGAWDLNADGYPQTNEVESIAMPNCGYITIGFRDQVLPICVDANGKYKSLKVLRTWKMYDDCKNDYREWVQLIKVVDKTAPVLGTLKDTTVLTYTHKCEGEINDIHPFVIKECSGYTWTIESKAGKVIGHNVIDLPATDKDPHTIYIIVTDDCGNSSSQELHVWVEDKTPPTMICDYHDVVALDQFGYAELNATAVGSDSRDNCGIERFEIKRDNGICDFANLSYRSKVTFCCADVNIPQKVWVRGYDYFGNYNDCDVTITVQSKQPARITCPKSITIDCHQDYRDTTLTGVAKFEAVCGASLSFEDNPVLNLCGIGYVDRIWKATEINGFVNSCVQRIVVEDRNPFNGQIVWPIDRTINGCHADADPSIAGEPQFGKDYCARIQHTYKDQEFYNVDSSCIKILRRWSVLDWCTYQTNGLGLYEHTQIIKITNTKAPVIKNCGNVVVEANESCVGEYLTDVIAEDECTDADQLLYSFRIQIDGDPNNVVYLNKNHDKISLTEGFHTVHLTVSDLCGNASTCNYVVEVRDVTPPKIYCNTDIVTVIMPSTGDIELWAKDFVISADEYCNGPVVYSFDEQNLIPNKRFTCNDIPNGISEKINLDIWVWDQKGNKIKCNVNLILQDNTGDKCRNRLNATTVQGFIKTNKDRSMQAVSVSTDKEIANTGKDGDYKAELMDLQSAIVKAAKTDADISGVTTADIVRVQKHILGTQTFTSPYEHIAADINESNSVTAADISIMRKMILGIIPPDNLWKFVVKNPELSIQNPFNYQEEKKLIIGEYNVVDFVGVKLGDINDDANLGFAKTNGRSAIQKTVWNYSYNESASQFDVLANESKDIEGFQVAVLLPEGSEFEEILGGQINLSVDNYYEENEKLRISFNSANKIHIKQGEVLFSIKMKNQIKSPYLISDNTIMSNELYCDGSILEIQLNNLSNEVLRDIEITDVVKDLDGKLKSVNIFSTMTGNAILQIHDMSGKIIEQQTITLLNQTQQIALSKMNLSAGIYVVSVHAEGKTKWKKVNVN